MVEDGGAILPVLFSDGERETNMGSIKIHPSTEFKTFQEYLCQTIGVSPNQISVYLVDDHRRRRRRIPITSKANFALIAKESEYCSFLVVLKRSTRRRSMKPRQQGGLQFGDVLGNYRLLRRDQPPDHVYDRFSALRYRDLQIQRENCARMMMMMNSVPVTDQDHGFRVSSKPFCEECASTRAEGSMASFHCCVFDEVAVGLRSTAAPIARPRN